MPIKSFLVDIDLNKNQLLNAKLQNLATPPPVVSGDTGVFYWSTTDKTAYFWTGTIWKSLEAYSYVHPNHYGDVVSNGDSGTTIQPNVVTNSKLAQMANYTIKGRFSPNTGNPEDISIADVRTMIGAVLKTDYSLPYTILGTQASGNSPTEIILGTNSALGRINGDIQAISIDNDLSSVSLNDDTLASAKAIKYYIDLVVTGALVYEGGYDASTNTPMLDVTPISGIKKGWTFTVTNSGTFFSVAVQAGDMLIAEVNDPIAETDWTIVNKNIPDIVSASTTSEGIVYLATNAEVASGINTTKAITPSSLSSITQLGTITGGTWQAGVISSIYGGTGINNGGRTLTVSGNSGTLNFSSPSKILTILDNATISGNNTGDQTNIIGNSGSANTIAIIDDNSTPANMYPTWVIGNSGNQASYVSSSKIFFNPSTGLLTSTLYAGTWNGNLISGLYGGTGVNNNGKTITLGGNLITSGAFQTTISVTNNTNVTLPTGGTLTTKYAVDITGNSIITSFIITHNLATTDIVTFVKEVTTSAKVEVEEIVTNANTLTINFNTPPANGKVYRVVVVG